MDVGERQLCQVLMRLSHLPAICGDYRFFQRKESFRNGIVKIAATKISAGVSTGIGDHEGQIQRKGD